MSNSQDSNKIMSATFKWDTEAKERISSKEFITPQDYIGAIMNIEGSCYRIVSFQTGGYGVVFDLLNLDTGKIDKAIKMALADFDPETILNKQLGEALRHIKENPDKVIQICDRLLEFNPNNEAAALLKAAALSVKGELEQALELYDLAIAIAPTDLANWLNKGIILAKLNKHTEALEHFWVAASSNSKGVSSYLQQMKEQAAIFEESINKVIELNPQQGTRARDALRQFFQLSKEPLEISPEESIPEESIIEFAEPLFDNTDRFSLSEADITPGTYGIYEMGSIIAIMHLHGMLHGDVHKGNFLFDPRAGGRPVIIDPDHRPLTNKLDPTTMGCEFIAPFRSFSREEFVTFLAGYTKIAYLRIDLLYPNYTDILLHLIGGHVTKSSKPREKYIGMQRSLELIATHFEITDEYIQLAECESKKIIEQLDVNPEEFFVTFIGLLLLRIDISRLLTEYNSASIKSEIGNHVFDLVSGYYTGEPVVKKSNYESEIIAIGVDLLQELQVEQSRPNLEIQAPGMSAFMTLAGLAKILPKLKFPLFLINRFIDCLIDVSNYIAIYLDSKSTEENLSLARHLSVEFGQFSYLLFRYSPRDIQSDESRYLNIRREHKQLSWHSKLLDSEKDITMFFIKLGYVKSMCSSLTQVFIHSLEKKRPMYSFLWESIDISFRALAIAYISLEQSLLPLELENLNKIVYVLATGLFNSLRAYVLGMEQSGFWIDSATGGVYPAEEIAWVAELLEFLDKNSIDTEKGRRLLGRVNEFEYRIQPFLSDLIDNRY
jgi:tetratricopeptide (TPR) repeat protein